MTAPEAMAALVGVEAHDFWMEHLGEIGVVQDDAAGVVGKHFLLGRPDFLTTAYTFPTAPLRPHLTGLCAEPIPVRWHQSEDPERWDRRHVRGETV